MKPNNYKKVTIIILLLSINFSLLAQNKNQTKENCETETNKNTKIKKMETTQKNVLGTDLKLASIDPITGFFRTGFCATDSKDRGVHVVAAVVTDEFLNYSLSQGNDLISPYPASGFPGLKSGDVWCLCALRWKEALKAGVAPPVILEATNIKALDYVTLKELKSVKSE
ncbi:DUF2237 family protein [Flavobacterium sp.]|uniref:DUF2237 family protein n=1 Tax=Flavobacterium sp. TaxID=239 RepID=UPI0037529441